ncbi:hypothetical protein ScPMuIL_015149 [Solemya velum]
MESLQSVWSNMSGFDIIWTSLTGSYLLKTLTYSIAGTAGTHRELDITGTPGLVRFKKRPLKRMLLGFGVNSILVLVAYRHFFFGTENYGWMQSLIEQFSIPGRVSTDELSTLLGCSLLTVHSFLRVYRALYINVFSNTTQDIVDFVTPFFYSLAAGFCIFSEAPSLVGNVADWSILSQLSWRHGVALALFIWASYEDQLYQQAFAKTRKNRAGHIVSNSHKLPKTGMFQLVSSPHFLAEILIHLGIGVCLGFKHQSWWLCTAYVIVGHMTRARGRHEWFLRKFGDAVPQQCRSIIPYIL